MDTEQTTSIRAKPAPGWISVIPIPGASLKPDAPPQAAFDHIKRTLLVQGLPPHLESDLDEQLQKMIPGYMGGIVIELGTFPAGGVGFELPFAAGDTVYYSDQKGVPIGDYSFLEWDSVIAWIPQES